ncbi:MAG: tail fiber protein [Methylococcaceae bacterium]
MADRPNPYIRKDPGDIIRSGDWNELQIKAREEIYAHNHSGGDKGIQISGAGIDPKSDVIINSLITNDLTIKGKAILGDIQNLLDTVKNLTSNKVNKAGDTINGDLTVSGVLNAKNLKINNQDLTTSLDTKLDKTGGTVNGSIEITNTLNTNSSITIGDKNVKTALTNEGILRLKGSAPQIDFIDSDHNDWAIHVNSSKMYFIRQPWSFTDLVLDGTGRVGVGTDNPSEKLEVAGRIKDQTGYVMPIGTILSYMGTSAPQGWLICDGSAIPSAYSDLIALIGATTPNLRGRTLIGSGQGAGLTNRTLKDIGGEENHVLSANEMPSHQHQFPGDDGLGSWVTAAYAINYDATSGGGNGRMYWTGATGGSQAHNNMQPFFVVNYIIKC